LHRPFSLFFSGGFFSAHPVSGTPFEIHHLLERFFQRRPYFVFALDNFFSSLFWFMVFFSPPSKGKKSPKNHSAFSKQMEVSLIYLSDDADVILRYFYVHSHTKESFPQSLPYAVLNAYPVSIVSWRIYIISLTDG